MNQLHQNRETSHRSGFRRFGLRMVILAIALPVLTPNPARADEETITAVSDMIQILLPVGGASYAIYRKDYEGLNQYIYSFTGSWASTYSLKLLATRARPSYGDTFSYPSGHTMAAFSGASFIQRRYGEEMGLWQWTPYVAASYVGYSRLYANAHDMGDVIAGALLGILPTYAFTTPIGTQGKIEAYTSDSHSGLSLSVPLPAGGRHDSLSFRSAFGWSGYAFEVPGSPIFSDPYDLSRTDLAGTRARLQSEVIGLPEDIAGWVDTRAVLDWRVSKGHQLSIELPYLETDLVSVGNFEGGLGDIQLGYRWATHPATDPRDFYQGLTTGLSIMLPTGQAEDAQGSGTTILAPTISASLEFFDGKVGFFPALTYLKSSDRTHARAIPTDSLVRPGLPFIEPELDMKAFVIDLPLSYRFGNRWTIGTGATIAHDRERATTDWMLNAMLGFKVSNRSTFRVDYGENLNSSIDSAIYARLKIDLTVNF